MGSINWAKLILLTISTKKTESDDDEAATRMQCFEEESLPQAEETHIDQPTIPN